MKKKRFIILSTAFCIFLFTNYTVLRKTAGAHPGSTGAPGDGTCAAQNCHADANITLNAINNSTLIFSSMDSAYIPGATYNITLQTQGAIPSVKFGFECLALKDNGELNVGEFEITDFNPVRTQTLSHAYGTDTRYSVTHTAIGTTSTSTNFDQWTFNWTAPPVNEGTITFYFATNCTNNDGTNSGDAIFLNKFQIHPAAVNSLKELAIQFDLRTYFESETNSFKLHYNLKGTRMVKVSILDINGKSVFDGPSEKLSDSQDQTIAIKNKLAKGTYLILLNIDEQKITRKLVLK